MIANSAVLAATIVLFLLLSLMKGADIPRPLGRPLPRASGGLDGASTVGVGVITKMTSSGVVARHAFGSPPVRRRIDFVPALCAAAGQLMARADDTRTRDGGAHRLWRCFAAAWVWTHHPSQGRAENPRVLLGNPLLISGLQTTGFPAAYKDSLRQLVCLLRVTGIVESTRRVARKEFPCA